MDRLSRPVFFVAVALIFGVIGCVRAVAEFGTAGVIAFTTLVVGPAAAVFLLFVLGAGRYAGEIPPLRPILIGVAVLTGMACVLSALFGVAWLVTR